jgi:hypothetical protein
MGRRQKGKGRRQKGKGRRERAVLLRYLLCQSFGDQRMLQRMKKHAIINNQIEYRISNKGMSIFDCTVIQNNRNNRNLKVFWKCSLLVRIN